MITHADIKAQYQSRLLKSSAIKNKVLKLWLKYGEVKVVDGVKYLGAYRIDGNSAGAIEMSNALKQPNLHNEASGKGIDSVKLYFNLTKLTNITQEKITAWLKDYKNRLTNRATLFNGFYYAIDSNRTIDAYFSKDGVRINSSFFNELAFELSEAKRVSNPFSEYWRLSTPNTPNITYEWQDHSQHPNDAFFDRLAKITYQNSACNVDEIKQMMDILDDNEMYHKVTNSSIPFPTGDPLYRFKLPAVREKIIHFAIENQIGDNSLDLSKLTKNNTMNFIIVNISYVSYDELRKLNAIAFLKLLGITLDTHVEKDDGNFWKNALVSFVVIIVSVVLIVVGMPYAGASLLIGYMGAKMNNKYLQAIAIIISIYGGTGGMEAIANMGYAEAIELVMNVASLYETLRPKIAQKPQEESLEDIKYLVYSYPYEDIYTQIYSYDEFYSLDFTY